MIYVNLRQFTSTYFIVFIVTVIERKKKTVTNTTLFKCRADSEHVDPQMMLGINICIIFGSIGIVDDEIDSDLLDQFRLIYDHFDPFGITFD